MTLRDDPDYALYAPSAFEKMLQAVRDVEGELIGIQGTVNNFHTVFVVEMEKFANLLHELRFYTGAICILLGLILWRVW